MSPGTTKPLSLSLPEYCNTDGDAAILSLSVETPLPPPGQSHVGVVSTNLQWGLKHFVAEPVVAQQKTVLGEKGFMPHLQKCGMQKKIKTDGIFK